VHPLARAARFARSFFVGNLLGRPLRRRRLDSLEPTAPLAAYGLSFLFMAVKRSARRFALAIAAASFFSWLPRSYKSTLMCIVSIGPSKRTITAPDRIPATATRLKFSSAPISSATGASSRVPMTKSAFINF
jgi:hypothetical protein